MQLRKKYRKEPSNVVYQVDGASYGMDDRLVAALRDSIRAKAERGQLDVPRLPAAASRILQLSQKPDVQVSEISDAVKTDSQLAKRVLKICNSAASGGSSCASP